MWNFLPYLVLSILLFPYLELNYGNEINRQ